VGTWVNSANDGLGGEPPAKIVADESHGVAFYNNASDTVPVATGTYSVSEDWVEDEAHWLNGVWSLSGTSLYFLTKIYGEGNTVEVASSETAYPTTISPSNPYYVILYRE
jgi:hypothetical protein